MTVSCQTERSQHQNREYALRILRARMLKRRDKQRAAELARVRGPRNHPERGRQTRSYFFHPCKLVKDHSTGHKPTDPHSVLGGNITLFIEAFIVQKISA